VLDLSVTISPDHQIIRSPDHPITRSPDGFQLPDYPIFNLAGRASVVGVAFGFQSPDYPMCSPPVYPKI
jgi:hypothetical protein